MDREALEDLYDMIVRAIEEKNIDTSSPEVIDVLSD